MISFLYSQRYENGGIYVLYIAIQYFRLGYSDWLSSVFLRPPCILEIPRELLINLLAPPDPTQDQLNQNLWGNGGECGAWASGNPNVQPGLGILVLEQRFYT